MMLLFFLISFKVFFFKFFILLVLSRTVYVGGVVNSISQSALAQVFEQEAGVQVESVILNSSKFSAFVKLATRNQAEKARERLRGFQLEGNMLKVSFFFRNVNYPRLVGLLDMVLKICLIIAMDL